MGFLCTKMVEMMGTAPMSLEVIVNAYYHRLFWYSLFSKRSKRKREMVSNVLRYASETMKGSGNEDPWV